MNYQLIFHPQATAEYAEAYQWYEREQKGLGDRFEGKVEEGLFQLQSHPENYGIIKSPYREVSLDVFPYVIVYRINKRKRIIYVSAIYHNSRNPGGKYRK